MAKKNNTIIRGFQIIKIQEFSYKKFTFFVDVFLTTEGNGSNAHVKHHVVVRHETMAGAVDLATEVGKFWVKNGALCPANSRISH